MHVTTKFKQTNNRRFVDTVRCAVTRTVSREHTLSHVIVAACLGHQLKQRHVICWEHDSLPSLLPNLIADILSRQRLYNVHVAGHYSYYTHKVITL